jgi:hypothetical protein
MNFAGYLKPMPRKLVSRKKKSRKDGQQFIPPIERRVYRG